jgi:hypothetical protein
VGRLRLLVLAAVAAVVMAARGDDEGDSTGSAADDPSRDSFQGILGSDTAIPVLSRHGLLT